MCEKTLQKEYEDRILAIADKLEKKQRFDSNEVICGDDYRKAKRFKNILKYLSGSACCPDKVKRELLEKLQLNGKL